MIVKSLIDKVMLREGKEYFAFEITFVKKSGEVYYRVVTEFGALGLIESKNFTILNGSLKNMVYEETDKQIIIQLSEIKELADKSLDIEGVWGEYYDNTNMEVCYKIAEIVKKEAKAQGIEIPEPEW